MKQPQRVPNLAFALVVATMGALGAGCDTRCVGPACVPDIDTDTTVVVDTVVDTDVPDPDDDERNDALAAVRSCDLVRFHKPDRPYARVEIAGSFNDWEPTPLQGPDEDGWWSVDLGALPAGTYPYKYLYLGQWESQIPASAELQWEGGVENRMLVVNDCTLPRLEVVSAEATAQGSLTEVVRYALGRDGSALDPAAIRGSIGGQTVQVAHDVSAQTLTLTATGLPPGKHTVRLTVADAAGRAGENTIFTPLWVEETPFAWTDGLMYLVFVDRFRDGDGDAATIGGTGALADYMGGDLLGVQQAIEDGWFDALGIRSIWLSPLYDNPDQLYAGVGDGAMYGGYHGYWPIKARAVESRFGDDAMTAADRLKAMVATAHDHGIRVVFDGVFNHVHDQHEWLGQHPGWFGGGCVCGSPGCGWEEKPIECWFTSYMPDLDHTNPAITDALIDDTLWWVREFDLDGLRIDAVKHMRRVMTVDLRHRLRDEIEAGGGAKVYTVGETFTGSDGHGQLVDRIGPWEMDAQFDFPVYWTLRDVFAHGGSMRSLENVVRTGVDSWGNAPMSPFAGNHDIPRLATEIAGNTQPGWGTTPDLLAGSGAQDDLAGRVISALTFVATQPGVPLLYYGDEIGLAGAGDPDNRRRMTFDPNLSSNQSAVLAKVRRAGQARAELRALQRGAWTPLWAEQDLLVFARHVGDDVALVALSRGGSRTTDVPVQGLLPDGTVLRDRMTDGRTTTITEGRLRLTLSGHDAAILAP